MRKSKRTCPGCGKIDTRFLLWTNPQRTGPCYFTCLQCGNETKMNWFQIQEVKQYEKDLRDRGNKKL